MSVRQVGFDRVIEIVVGGGGGPEHGQEEDEAARLRQRRIFLEFFAAGNIVVTDGNLNVVALLREVREGDEKVDVKIGGKYRLDVKQGYLEDGKQRQRLGVENLRNVLQKHVDKTKMEDPNQGAVAKKAKKRKGADDLKKIIANDFSQYPTYLLEHVFKMNDFDASTKPDEPLGNTDKMNQLMSCIQAADTVFQSLITQDKAKGYIIAKIKEDHLQKAETAPELRAPSREDLLYDDFHPFRPSQFEDNPQLHIVEIEGFNATVDEFYSSLESQKLTSRLTEREETARRKLETAKAEHEKRLGALQHVQELHIRKAQAIEANPHRVEEACAAVNGLIAQGMDWMDIGKLIENEQRRGNSVAQLVKLPLKLYENTVTLVLDEPGDNDDSDDETLFDEEEDDSKDDSTAPSQITHQPLNIDIDLALSPWANARQYYDQKKTAAAKEQKTLQASSRALKSTEKKIEADLKKGLKQEVQTLRATRHQFFFEKFFYFISSDGYLILGGKDAQQSEILYRKHLKKGDVYVHADLNGATSVVVKNNPMTPDAPIPPGTLSQAGALAVCSSSAWESKAVMAAWWVNAEQVSKTVEGTGQYLSGDGDFYVRGQKSFLPPSQLLLGFGVLWLIDEEDRKNHGKSRVYGQGSAHGTLSGGVKSLAIEDAAAKTTNEDVSADDEVHNIENVEEDLDDHNGEAGPGEQGEEVEEQHDSDHLSVDAESEQDEDDRQNPVQMSAESNGDRAISSSDTIHGEVEGSVDEAAAHHDDENPDTTSELASDPDQASTPSVSSRSKPTTTTTSSTSTTPNPSASSKLKPPPRGKQSKTSRAKARKYAAQSDDDRALAMQLLGHHHTAPSSASGSSTPNPNPTDAAQAAREKEKEDKLRRERDKRRLRLEKARRDEEKRQAAQGGSGGDDPAGQVDDADAAAALRDLASLDLLVPQAHPDDTIHAALPVVAPWSALARYKYKVKLQPGGTKRGKAVREMVGAWVDVGRRFGLVGAGGVGSGAAAGASSVSAMAPAMEGAEQEGEEEEQGGENGNGDEDGTRSGKGEEKRSSTRRDPEKVWAEEMVKIADWRVEEIVGILPVKGCRVVRSANAAAAGAGKGGAGGGGGGKQSARGGRGSKKAR